MPVETSFRIVFALLFSALVVIRFYFHNRARVWEKGVANPSEGAAVPWLRMGVGIPWMATLFAWLLMPEKVAFLLLPIPSLVRWLGVPITLSGLWLLIQVHRALDVYFSPFLRIREGHRLITSGPYAHIRHPMYTSFLLLMVGLALISAHGMALLGVLLGIPALASRTIREEAMLEGHFGAEWRRHVARTGRLLPRWRGVGESGA